MTMRQVIYNGPANANKLFGKLAETGDGAVKTREWLFADLKAELELLAGLEEKNLFPVLRKHQETKALVADALADNKQVRALLAELEQMPKKGPDFLGKLAELRKVFQQHVRDDKREMLPAVAKALSEEEVQAVAEKIHDGKAQAEEAKQEEAERQRVEAKQEREAAKAEEAEQEEAKRQEAQAAEHHAQEAAEAVTRPIETMARGALRAVEAGGAASEAGAGITTQGSRQVADEGGQAVQETAASASDMAGRYHAAASQVLRAEGGLAGFWFELVREQVAQNTETFRKLTAARDWREAIELQGALVHHSFERMGRLSGRYLETVQAVLVATSSATKDGPDRRA